MPTQEERLDELGQLRQFHGFGKVGAIAEADGSQGARRDIPGQYDDGYLATKLFA
jgi:hypothetical protein